MLLTGVGSRGYEGKELKTVNLKNFQGVSLKGKDTGPVSEGSRVRRHFCFLLFLKFVFKRK